VATISSSGNKPRAAGPTLWHLTLSPFSEKVRWTLDYKGLPHHRRHILPGPHALVAFALTRRVATFPVLTLDGKAIGDSTRIIAALEENFPDPPVYPHDVGERRRALELEERFDTVLGPAVRRYGFYESLRDPDYVRRSNQSLASPRQQRAVSMASPLFLAFIRRRFKVNAQSAAEALVALRESLDEIESILGDRPYLVGDRFSIADLTAAALLAPLLVPPGLPYRDPSLTPPPRLEKTVAEIRERPAGRWVFRTYELHRPGSSEIPRSSNR
jgi:glutathione S-transferase